MIERFEEFTSNISQAYKYIVKIKAYEMKTFGLKGAHVMCLFSIGKHSEGLTAGELAELCKEDKAGISKSLSELKNQGLITAENNGRVYKAKYFITEKGLEIYNKVSNLIVGIVDECSGDLNEAERAKFYKTLSAIVENLENCCKRLEDEQ